MLRLHIFVEEGEALLASQFGHIVAEFVTTTEYLIELIVAETDDAIVLNSATVVYL